MRMPTQATGTAGGVSRRWAMAVVGVLVALVASGCELILDLAGSTPGPLVPLGPVVDAGRVAVAGAGFAITVPDDWIVEVASPMPDMETTPVGAAWEVLRTYAPGRSDSCSVHVSLPPEGALSESEGVRIGSGEAFPEPRLRMWPGEPTLLVPAPRIESALPQRFGSLTTRQRVAASDPGTPRDVLYGLVCLGNQERDFDTILDTFQLLPIPPAGIVPGAAVTVSLGIYSGRSDPSWSLSEAQTAELRRLVDALPPATGEPPEGGLGYHGFSIAAATGAGETWTLVAYRGAVARPRSGPRVYLVDTDRTVERYLLDTGRAHLSGAEVSAVDTDLATHPEG